MGLAEELLQVAAHLAIYEGPDPTQAALRRAISTAYYAVFHLLIEDAAQRSAGKAHQRLSLVSNAAFSMGQ